MTAKNEAGCSDVDSNVVEAVYSSNYGAHRPGIETSEVVAYYDKWADKYEVDMKPGIYNGPKYGAQALARHFSANERKEVKIIDVAAGTGLCGVELAAKGFVHVDSLEPSIGMVNVSKAKGVYKRFIVDTIGYHKTEIEEGTYDGLVITGGMGEGHIPVEAMDEMIRIVRPGGVVCIVMREEYLTTVGAYVNTLEPYMEKRVTDGSWKKLSRTRVDNYSFNKVGIIFMFEVLK